MASNKRLIDIEREINDFFLSKEFEKLAFSNGAYRLGEYILSRYRNFIGFWM